METRKFALFELDVTTARFVSTGPNGWLSLSMTKGVWESRGKPVAITVTINAD